MHHPLEAVTHRETRATRDILADIDTLALPCIMDLGRCKILGIRSDVPGRTSGRQPDQARPRAFGRGPKPAACSGWLINANVKCFYLPYVFQGLKFCIVYKYDPEPSLGKRYRTYLDIDANWFPKEKLTSFLLHHPWRQWIDWWLILGEVSGPWTTLHNSGLLAGSILFRMSLIASETEPLLARQSDYGHVSRKARVGPREISRSTRYGILAGIWSATFLSVQMFPDLQWPPTYKSSIRLSMVSSGFLLDWETLNDTGRLSHACSNQ